MPRAISIKKPRHSLVSSEISLSWLDRCSSADRASRWYVYLLPSRGESSFKIGFTCSPLQRIATFSQRYFERFDLHQSRLLLATSNDAAREIEFALKSEFAEHSCAAPPWIPMAAGGLTEWFSVVSLPSAVTRLRSFAENQSPDATVATHDFVAELLTRARAEFERWAFDQAARLAEDLESMRLGYTRTISPEPLRDWFDAYRYFAIDLYADDPAALEFVRSTIAARFAN